MFIITHELTLLCWLVTGLVADLGALTIAPKPTTNKAKSTRAKANPVKKDGDPSPAE
jgi:hypothetical protein